MTGKQRLGELLVDKKLVAKEAVAEALRIQVGGNRRLGYILIKMGLLTDEQLQDVLSQQLELPIVDVQQEFSESEKRTLPRYLCKQFNVLPLGREKNNILKLAMMDPMDDVAIAEIENYTGLAVKPFLARQRDIDHMVGSRIPFSLRDIINPAIYGKTIRAVSLVALVLAVGAGYMLQHYVHQQEYGTVSHSGATKIYKNHDLMVGCDTTGKISLMGRGAYSSGFYSVSFTDAAAMQQFIQQKKKDLSEKQYSWLLWLVNQQLKPGNS